MCNLNLAAFEMGRVGWVNIYPQSKDNDLDSPIEKARTPALSPLDSFSSGLLELSLL